MTARITLKSTAFVLCTATAVVAQDVADAIYSNGKIYTVDEQASWAEAVAIKDGRFIAVGAAEDVLALSGPNMETYDLEDRVARIALGPHLPLSPVRYATRS